jgi:hypothetical protein
MKLSDGMEAFDRKITKFCAVLLAAGTEGNGPEFVEA